MSRFDYDEWRDREPFELMRKVEHLDGMLDAAERTLCELRAVDEIYDDLDAMALVFADASCEPGESFAVAIECVERGLSESEARAEVRAKHATAGPRAPFGALVPCDAADLFLGPVLSAEQMALVRSWLVRPAPDLAGARLVMLAAGALALTVAMAPEPTLSGVDWTSRRQRTPNTWPRMPERVTGDRAPKPAGHRSYAFFPGRSMIGELLVRADTILDAASRWPERERPPLVLLLAHAGTEPGASLAAAVIGAQKGVARPDALAQIQALVDPFEPPLVFARFLQVPIATFFLAEQLGEDIAGALAMWLEKVRPGEAPIITLSHDHIALVLERTRKTA